MESKKITIYDIAQEAGVSVSTVSRVLTNNARVSAEKKEKVLQIINKYDFKPNALARGLADTRRKTIGIIVADVRNPFYADLFVACEQAADEQGYTVLLCNSLGQQELEEKQLEKLVEQRVDAIIQVGGRVDDLISNEKYVEKVNWATNTIPMVTTGKLDGTSCYHVRIDAMQAMDLIMEYLISNGHRDIAFIGGRKDVLSTFDKIQRYKQLLQRYQIPVKEELTENNNSYDYHDGYEKMSEMLESNIVPTAVIAINDSAAAGIQASIRDHHYQIPEDISVVSFDNTYIAEVTRPHITSIDYNYGYMGKVLIDTALALIEGKEVPRVQMINSKLVVRSSSGPCKEK